MKRIIYKCDGEGCSKETNNIETNNWVEIGSNDKKLLINNYLTDRKIISMANYDDIHFCSSNCLSGKFFTNSEKIKFFTESEIQQLQSEVHKITGDGEVMGLFNNLLGIQAG